MKKIISIGIAAFCISAGSIASENSRLYRPPPSPADEETGGNAGDKPRLGDIPDETQKKASSAESSRKPIEISGGTAASKQSDKPRLGDIPEGAQKGVLPPETAKESVEPKTNTAAEKTGEKPRLGDIPKAQEKKDKKTQPVLEGITPEERKKLLEEVAQEFYEKGEVAYQEGQLQEARDFLERVMTLQPNHTAARKRLEMVIRILEPPEPEPKPTLPIKDSKAVLINKLSVELDQAMKNKDWDRSERVIKNILAVDPNNDKAKARQKIVHSNLAGRAADRALVREKAGDLQGAVDAYRVAINYSRNPIYTDKIELLLEKITDINNRKSDDLYRQALDANQGGFIDKAISLCKEALLLNPDNIQAERMLDRLESRIPS